MHLIHMYIYSTFRMPRGRPHSDLRPASHASLEESSAKGRQLVEKEGQEGRLSMTCVWEVWG